jgi:hypothetical protein
MPHYAFLLLLVFFLLLSLAWLWYLYWFHHGPPHSRAVALHPAVHRLRHRHAPHTIVQPVASPPLSRQVKSQLLRLYAPGVMSKVAGEHPSG